MLVAVGAVVDGHADERLDPVMAGAAPSMTLVAIGEAAVEVRSGRERYACQ